jgi:hypothetical protein
MASVMQRLEGIDTEALGRASGFIRRACRKLEVPMLCKALAGLAGMGSLTLELIVQTLGLLGHQPYSAQALCKRVGPGLEKFLLAVIAALFRRQADDLVVAGCFAPFRRVLVLDSTTVARPDRFASVFAGCVNQSSRTLSQVKLQCVFDLVRLSLVQFSFSGFTRNDQAAAADILDIVRRGDLVLRDLGYFSCKTLARLTAGGVHYLTRLRSGVLLHDPVSGPPLNLARVLKRGESLDRMVLMGEDRLPVRLVAVPVPQAVGGQRRRESRRDRRSHPSRERLYLMDWNIFVTTVTAETWGRQQVCDVYRLRWTIEIIFKAWKSHLRLEALNTHSEAMLRLSIITQLFQCTLTLWCWAELQASASRKGHASILRVARTVSMCAALIACILFGQTPEEMIKELLAKLSRHRPRRDRTNLSEQLANLCANLG